MSDIADVTEIKAENVIQLWKCSTHLFYGFIITTSFIRQAENISLTFSFA